MNSRQETLCPEIVGVHDREPWTGHPIPCGRTSIAHHPLIVERWEGICIVHLHALVRGLICWRLRPPMIVAVLVVDGKKWETELDWLSRLPTSHATLRNVLDRIERTTEGRVTSVRLVER